MFGHHRGRGRGHDMHDRSGFFEEIREMKAARRRERLFEQGDLKLVVLDLLKARPRHGYEVIKAIEELAGGDYTPSPGVIYPTLTLLEEMGYATVTQEQGGKKQYGITPEGNAFLEEQAPVLERILARIESAGSAADARHSPELRRAIQNFRMALHFRLSRGKPSSDELRKIADAIDRAAVEIERS